MIQKNWAGNVEFNAANWHTPHSVDALQEIVAQTHRIRPVGTRHSFSKVADSNFDLVSLAHLCRVVSIDRENRQVTVEAGIRYGELCQFLAQEGFALHNLASLVHIGVAGACATATHGSGLKNGNLSTAVQAVEMVRHDGEIVRMSKEKDGDAFNAVVVGLGGFGVVAKLTLAIEPAFNVQQIIYQKLPFANLERHFEEVMGSAYSVSLFTDWSGDTVNQVWLKHRVIEGKPFVFPGDIYGAKPALEKLHPVFGFPVESCTDQLGIPGPWHDRLQHFKLDFTPSAGEELQAEYLLPIENAVPALQAVNSLRQEIHPLLYTSEIRTVASDALWMSTAYEQQSIAIHFTWKPEWKAVKTCLGKIEALLTPLGARPHWGKLFTMPANAVQDRYEKLPAFRTMMNDWDPERKFRNAFVDRYIG